MRRFADNFAHTRRTLEDELHHLLGVIADRVKRRDAENGDEQENRSCEDAKSQCMIKLH
jgi:hypothetical protein